MIDLQSFPTGDFQATIVDAKQMQDSGVQVGHIVTFAERMVAEFIGFTVHIAFLESCTCHPDSEAIGMMVSPIDSTPSLLESRSSTELGAEHDQGVFQHASSFQVNPAIGRSTLRQSRVWLSVSFWWESQVP